MPGPVNGVLLTGVVIMVSLTTADSDSVCSGGQIDIYINDTVSKDSVIDQLNGTGSASLSCPELYLDSSTNSVILNISLRSPCYPSSSFRCPLMCGIMETSTIFVTITRSDQFPPLFERPLYKTSVNENADIGTEVFRFRSSTNVTDQDCGTQSFNYKIEQVNFIQVMAFVVGEPLMMKGQ